MSPWDAEFVKQPCGEVRDQIDVPLPSRRVQQSTILKALPVPITPWLIPASPAFLSDNAGVAKPCRASVRATL